jgi:hypothetical protein
MNCCEVALGMAEQLLRPQIVAPVFFILNELVDASSDPLVQRLLENVFTNGASAFTCFRDIHKTEVEVAQRHIRRWKKKGALTEEQFASLVRIMQGQEEDNQSISSQALEASAVKEIVQVLQRIKVCMAVLPPIRAREYVTKIAELKATDSRCLGLLIEVGERASRELITLERRHQIPAVDSASTTNNAELPVASSCIDYSPKLLTDLNISRTLTEHSSCVDLHVLPDRAFHPPKKNLVSRRPFRNPPSSSTGHRLWGVFTDQWIMQDDTSRMATAAYRGSDSFSTNVFQVSCGIKRARES